MEPLTQQTATVAVLKLAHMDPFGDDADPDSALCCRKFEGWKDDGDVIFNSAI